MAWELPSHMTSYIEPSIVKWANENPEEFKQYCKDEEIDYENSEITITLDMIARSLVDGVLEYATTTNGGHEFYMPDEWTTIAWCDEDYCLEYWS